MSIDSQLDALDERIAKADPEERQRLYLRREKLQERQFKESIKRRAKLQAAKERAK